MKTSHRVLVMLAASASLAASIPAFADDWEHERGYGHWHHHDEGHVFYGRPEVVYAPAPVYYGPQVVYVQPPVYYAPQVVYEQPPVAYGPLPVVYSQPQPMPVYRSPNTGAVGGAIAGAVIGSRFGRGDGRLVSTAVGTFLGAMIGGRM